MARRARAAPHAQRAQPLGGSRMSLALLQALSASLTEAPGVIRFGIIGTGCIGQEHLRNLHLIPECQVVAIADTHEPSLEAGRETLRKQGADGGVVCVADYRALLALPQVDAVLVATPNDHHSQFPAIPRVPTTPAT